MSKKQEKKSFVLRLSQDQYDALEKWASDEFRSVNGQLEWIIAKALKEKGRDSKKRNNRFKKIPFLNYPFQ